MKSLRVRIAPYSIAEYLASQVDAQRKRVAEETAKAEQRMQVQKELELASPSPVQKVRQERAKQAAAAI
jgi:hypothetical protein